MAVCRLLRAASAGAAVIACLAALSSCKVDKAALARQVGLQDVNLVSVPDGVYEAAYTIAPPPGTAAANKHVRVRVTVAAGRYRKIELLEPTGLSTSKMTLALIARIEESQKLSTDAISGATITSTAILKAVQEAVSSAAK
jgi:uncharacterized protein with FMN-binding domain